MLQDMNENIETNKLTVFEIFFSLSHIPTSTSQYLPKNIKKDFYNCLDKLCENYISNSNEVNLLLILALPKIGLCPIITKGNISATKKRLQTYPDVEWPDFDLLSRNIVKRSKISGSDRSTSTLQQEINVKLIKNAIAKGNISRASRLLNDEPFAISADKDTYEKLKKLHPDGNKDLESIKSKLTKGPSPFELKPDIIKAVALSIPLQTGVGISGWTSPLIINCINDDDTSFLNFLIILSRQILSGSAPGDKMLCSARLIPIKKR